MKKYIRRILYVLTALYYLLEYWDVDKYLVLWGFIAVYTLLALL